MNKIDRAIIEELEAENTVLRNQLKKVINDINGIYEEFNMRLRSLENRINQPAIKEIKEKYSDDWAQERFKYYGKTSDTVKERLCKMNKG